MKNWLIAIMGVSMAAISYTAYELELKSRPDQMPAQLMTADGKLIVPHNKERAGQPIVRTPDNVPVAQASKPETKDAEIKTVAKMPAPAADTVVSEGTKALEAAKNSAEMKMAAKAPEAAPLAASKATPKAQQVPEPELSMLDKAKGLVSNLFGGKEETKVAIVPKAVAPKPQTETESPSSDQKSVAENKPTVAPEATPEKSAEAPAAAKPQSLMEQAVGAVTNLFSTEEEADTAKATDSDASKEIITAARIPAKEAEPAVATKTPEPQAVTPKTSDPVAKATSPNVPSFDVVRVERDGSAVIAGRAEPGATVHLQAEGKSLGSAKASRRGEFVIIPDAPIPAGSSALSLKSELPDGKIVGSKQVVTVAVAGANSDAETKVAVVTPVPTTAAPAAGASTEQVAKSPTPAAQPAVSTEQKVAAAPNVAASNPTATVKMPKSEMASNTGAVTTANAPVVATTPGKSDGLAETQTAVIIDNQTGETTRTVTSNVAEVAKSAMPAPSASQPAQEGTTTLTQGSAPASNAVTATQPTTQATTQAATAPTKAAEMKVASAPQTPTAQTSAAVKAPTTQAAAGQASGTSTPKTAAPQVATVQSQQETSSSVAKADVVTNSQGNSAAPETIVAAVAPATNAPVAAPEAAAPAAPLVVISEPGRPSRVLQGAKSKPKTPVTFETVDYDDEGQIILAGQVAPGADVRAYLGAAHLGDAKASADGQWVLRTTRDIDPGVYQLRVDKIDVGGQVLARVTAPFERASPDAVARVRASGEVIIQPGDNLWNISRAIYGTGTQYTVIYDANRNQISEADLIFPGQVFMTPGAPDASAAKNAVQAQTTSG